MDSIIQLICALIGGGCTVFGVWYAHHLQKPSKPQGFMNTNAEKRQANNLLTQNKPSVLKDTAFTLLVIYMSIFLFTRILNKTHENINALIIMESILLLTILTTIYLKTESDKNRHLFKVMSYFYITNAFLLTIWHPTEFNLLFLFFAYCVFLFLIPIILFLAYIFSWTK